MPKPDLSLSERSTYRYREFLIFLVVLVKIGTEKILEPVSEKFGAGKSLGTGIGKVWYQKKVSELGSEKFGTRKSLENVMQKKMLVLNYS